MPVTFRKATAVDNAGLVALAGACSMRGGLNLCIERGSDFFALSRLFGDPWHVFVAADGVTGQVIGCSGLAFRQAYVHAQPREVAYLSDVKVHPDHRGPELAAADTLIRNALDACRAGIGGGGIMFFTIMRGNRHAEKWSPGLRGTPPLVRFSTVESFSIPLLWARRQDPDHTVTTARAEDVGEMIDLWRRLAPQLQFTQAFDEDSFARWIDGAPNLGISSYRLLRHRNGRLEGFWGLWDQHPVKQLRVVAYGREMVVPRLAFNAVARLAGAAPLPPPGGELRSLSAIHLCAPLEDPGVLRSLILAALRELRGRGYSTLNLSLDAKDPRRIALLGLFAQPTRVGAYAVCPDAGYQGPPLDDRPFHHEIALV
ncbi:MAG TPA: hypothetical protein VIG99_06250 [Myxococcaceae bacterium]|jgi:hypothetical protein